MQTSTSPESPPSPNALLLLDYLRRWAPRPELARPDRVIAKALNLPERLIVDLADELLRAGHLVVASCVHPMGRWLLRPEAPEEHWQRARDYVASLKERGVKILARQTHAASALRRTEAARLSPPPVGGQARLF